MALKIINGNLLDLFEQGEFDCIIHGCNCFNKMASGIAGQIAKRFPGALKADNSYNIVPSDKLGNFSVWTDRKNLKCPSIVNAYTQYNPGADFKSWALESVLWKISNWASSDNKVGVPWIGCGIGGSTKEVVQPIFERYADKFDITIVEFTTSFK